MKSTQHNSYLCIAYAYISILILFSIPRINSFSTAKFTSDGTSVQCQRRKSRPSLSSAFPLLQSETIQCQRPNSLVSLAVLKREEEDDGNIFVSSSPSLSRRSLLKGSAPFFIAMLTHHAHKSYADEVQVEEQTIIPPKLKRQLLKGTVSLKAGTENEVAGSEAAALYVTARPDRPDNVPRAILDGTGGKAPPVLAARFPRPSFPLDVSLSVEDLTAEGVAGVDLSSSGEGELENVKFWWEGEDLVVSARLDSDGVANTRDPTDLVGRGFFKHRGEGGDGFKVELQGRGVGGKFFTGAKK